MVCPRCNVNNNNNEQFCYNCGTRLERSGTAVASPTIMAPLPEAAPSMYNTSPTYNAPPAYGNTLNSPVTLPNSTTAIVSLIFGILGLTALPVIGSIVAVVAGHMARVEIQRSNGAVGGARMAMAGLITGYIVLIGVLVLFLLFFFTVFAATIGAN